jgi:hypothetical protein
MASKIISTLLDKYVGKRNEMLFFAFLNVLNGYVFCFEPKYLNKSL